MEVLDRIRPNLQHLRTIEDDPRWKAVQQILVSRGFAKSFRLIALLTYICRCALEDRSDEITEQQIGIHVFGRAPDYNPGEDNIVRTTARQLRQKLAVYYQEEGAKDQLRIDIPRGGYHPIFNALIEQTAHSVDHPSASPEETLSTVAWQVPVAHGVHLTRSAIVLGLIVAVLSGAAINLLVSRLIRRASIILPAVMAQVLSPNRTTVFVAGDSGLNMYDNLARTQVSLGEYVSGDYLQSAAAQPPSGYTWPSLASRRYTSFVDVQLSDNLRMYSQNRGVPLSIRFARDVRAEDFRHANVILAGAGTYNPWVSMFDSKLNFHLHYNGKTNAVTVLNATPLAGEPREFVAEEQDQARGYSHGFGYIALTNNVEGDGQVLLIEGSTVAGVDAAMQFVLSDSKMSPILKKVTAKNGRIGIFEILLAANFIKSSSPDSQILAQRTYK